MKKLLLLCLVSSACVTVDLTREAPARPDECDLDILTLPPSQPFEELGIVTPVASTPHRVTEAVVAKACAAGADAIVLRPAPYRHHASGGAATLIRYVDRREHEKADADVNAGVVSPLRAYR